jgi:hypothetical protein
MERDRNIAMGLGSNTNNAAAMIIIYQELTAHFGLITMPNLVYIHT